MKIIAALVALAAAFADWMLSDHSIILSTVGGAVLYLIIVLATRKAQR